MTSRATAVALVLASAAGCGFAVKHPAATAGIVGGSLALSTCELASSDHSSCLLASGGAAALLGLVAATALWLGDTGQPSVLQPGVDGAPLAAATPASAPPPPVTTPRRAPSLAPVGPPPAYLTQPPELWVRSGTQLVRAPDEDHAVAARYATTAERGPLQDGARLTILTAKPSYRIAEEVRVIHVLEAPASGTELHLGVPKPITGEYVDGVERTPPVQELTRGTGRVVASPGVDFHFEITTYRFDRPGPHRIQWRAGGRVSNVLELTVVP